MNRYKLTLNIIYLFFTFFIFSIFYFGAIGIIETPCNLYEYFTNNNLTSPIILIVVIFLRLIDYQIINKINKYYINNIDNNFNGIIISDKIFLLLTILFLCLQNYAYSQCLENKEYISQFNIKNNNLEINIKKKDNTIFQYYNIKSVSIENNQLIFYIFSSLRL